MNKEILNIKLRYERRKNYNDRYNLLLPNVILSEQEKERTIINLIGRKVGFEFAESKILEIGGGIGSNIFLFLKMGFLPENIYFNELLEERFNKAKSLLPTAIHFYQGNALDLNFNEEHFDIIYQSTVFTSILDPSFKKLLAEKIWRLLKPGGGILWYDFIYDNPFNKDVKGIPIKEIKVLFPEGKIEYKRITLLPQLARIITKIHPGFYTLFNVFPFLRTHVLCWIEK
jgi:ubiquinone/menaquinone biosynthesis C-methylase UbiE